MSNFSDFGSTFLDTLGDVVEGVGDSFSNNSDLEAAKVKRLNLNTEMAALEFEANEKRKTRNENMIKNVIYMIMGLIIFAFLVNQIPKIKTLV